MQELLEAMARRRSVVREIVDACVAMGEPIDLDTVAQVLAEFTAVTGDKGTTQPLDEDEFQVICGLNTVIGALKGLTWFMAERQKPGRHQRLLRELPDRIKRQLEDVLEPHMAVMSDDQLMRLSIEATLWAYLIWSPVEQRPCSRSLTGSPPESTCRKNCSNVLASSPNGTSGLCQRSNPREGTKHMNPTAEQAAILLAISKLPAPAKVADIASKVGRDVTAREIRLIVAGGLVQEVEVNEPPKCRFSLTTKGQKWVKDNAPPAPPPPDPPAQTVVSEATTPRGRRMNDETRVWLWSRFADGEGATRESAKALGEQIGFHYTSVRYQHQMWEKAGRPGMSPPPARADIPPFVNEVQPAPIEQPASELQQAAQVVTFDAGALVPEIEQSAPEVHNGEADLIGERSEMVEASVPPIELAPAAAVPSTSMAAALMKAGLELPSTQEEPEAERLPEVGQVYEGAVYAVDQGGMFAIVELVEFSDPGARRWLRGKVSRSQVLRRGWCDDVRDWLNPGDLVNVRVLEISPSKNKQGWKINLSIKQAPAHRHERIRLEAEEQHQRSEEPPIVATGAQVAAAIEAERAMPTQESVAPDPNPQLMARVAELEELLARKDEQVATQSETIGNLWSSMKALQASEARLTAGRDELVDTMLKVTREAEQLRREARGLCASCVHGLDKFCPYAEALVTPEFEVPAEELPDRHHGERIVFGRRPVVECSLYRPEPKVG